jgi:hypothetical protein
VLGGQETRAMVVLGGEVANEGWVSDGGRNGGRNGSLKDSDFTRDWCVHWV